MILPSEIAGFLAGARVTRNTTGYSHATVDLVEKPSGHFYLKTQKRDAFASLSHDLRILTWLEGQVPAPKPVLFAADDEWEHLVVTEVVGEPAYADGYAGERSAVVQEVARSGASKPGMRAKAPPSSTPSCNGRRNPRLTSSSPTGTSVCPTFC